MMRNEHHIPMLWTHLCIIYASIRHIDKLSSKCSFIQLQLTEAKQTMIVTLKILLTTQKSFFKKSKL